MSISNHWATQQIPPFVDDFLASLQQPVIVIVSNWGLIEIILFYAVIVKPLCFFPFFFFGALRRAIYYRRRREGARKNIINLSSESSRASLYISLGDPFASFCAPRLEIQGCQTALVSDASFSSGHSHQAYIVTSVKILFPDSAIIFHSQFLLRLNLYRSRYVAYRKKNGRKGNH